jgi:hypothetical protein
VALERLPELVRETTMAAPCECVGTPGGIVGMLATDPLDGEQGTVPEWWIPGLSIGHCVQPSRGFGAVDSGILLLVFPRIAEGPSDCDTFHTDQSSAVLDSIEKWPSSNASSAA